ncbi:hypothetical protein MN116_004088 [Schistosoma mekongi]|uniref:Large ribosomal subunit protein uL24 C-terminal domain-containing protein n=1 Tax=Schistosoma mekongi TaxID=38744 RepID=A0AAE1ZG21_SCHME|nr:hypothetical protein MN116_004088 [Schistosoma mekongi]
MLAEVTPDRSYFEVSNLKTISGNIYKFNYWPRYVARLIKFRPVYRKGLLGWRFETDHIFQQPDSLPNEMREEKFLPVWHFSDKPPWNIANRLSEFPYPNTIWCVIHPDGRKDVRKLQPMLPENQLIFKGDRVFILVGPDKGRIGIVSSVLKIRGMVYVDGLNYRITTSKNYRSLKRSEDPLHIDSQVTLVDPSNNEPCKCSWRYTKDGVRVRVSLQSGHVIPLPAAARYLDDLTDPKTAVVSSGDTCESIVSNITLNCIHSTSDVHFERSLSKHLNLKGVYLKPAFTYWY